jgi:hypothetical protein
MPNPMPRPKAILSEILSPPPPLSFAVTEAGVDEVLDATPGT